MATGIEVESSARPASGWQVSLADLIFLVLGAGLATGIARGAREVWGTRQFGSIGSIGVPLERTAGVGVEIASVWLAMIVARGMIALARGRRPRREATRRGVLMPMAWRALAIVLLLSVVMRQSWVLRVDAKALFALSPDVGGERYRLREMLVPICAILAMIGIALGMGAGQAFARSDPRRPRPYWLFVPLAALAAVLFMGLPNGEVSLVTQYIVIVLTHLSNALPPPAPRLEGSVSERLLRAGIEAIPAALACLWLALVVARDFERARRGERWATTIRGCIVRIASIATALTTGVAVALVAIPTIHPCLIDGFRLIVETEIIVMVVAGFGMFAAGLAARTLVPPPIAERSRRMVRLSDVLSLGLIVTVLLSAMVCTPSSTQLNSRVPAIVGRVCDLIRELPAHVLSVFPALEEPDVYAWLGPERAAWTLSMMVVGAFILELSFSRVVRAQPAPFDEVVESPGRMIPFVWLTAALTVVCIVAIPTLIVLGQVIVHVSISFKDWMAHGWPSPF